MQGLRAVRLLLALPILLATHLPPPISATFVQATGLQDSTAHGLVRSLRPDYIPRRDVFLETATVAQQSGFEQTQLNDADSKDTLVEEDAAHTRMGSVSPGPATGVVASTPLHSQPIVPPVATGRGQETQSIPEGLAPQHKTHAPPLEESSAAEDRVRVPVLEEPRYARTDAAAPAAGAGAGGGAGGGAGALAHSKGEEVAEGVPHAVVVGGEGGVAAAPEMQVAEEDQWAAELLIRVNAHRRSKDLHGFAEWSEGLTKPLQLPAWFKGIEHLGGFAMMVFEKVGVPHDSFQPLIKTSQDVSKAVGGVAMDVAEFIRGQPEVVQWGLLPGDHIRVRGVAGFMALTHHAIYLGDGKIMHFTGGVTDKVNATCKVDTLRNLHDFGKGKGLRLQVMEHPGHALPREDIVARALTLEGKTEYNLLSNNCEHVVNWCITNQSESHQVKKFLKDPLGLGREIMHMQEAAGQPLDLGEMCLTLLPPVMTTPFLAASSRLKQAFNGDKSGGKGGGGIATWRLPLPPWQKEPRREMGIKQRLDKWVQGVKLRATPPFLRPKET